MLQPFLDSRKRPQINTKSLLRWLVWMQGSPAEIGGFRGRANKLVDGCYSWWVGGAFSLLEALGVGAAVDGLVGDGEGAKTTGYGKGEEDEHEWDDVDGPSFSPATCLATLLIKYRLFLRPRSASGVYSLRRSTSHRRFTRQASQVRTPP